MSDSEGERDRREAARLELQALARRLREQARQLGDAEAVAAADRVHEHATSDPPNATSIKSVLASLETQIALSPTVNAILQALSNIGL